jgi:hypothetical protein
MIQSGSEYYRASSSYGGQVVSNPPMDCNDTTTAKPV